MRVPRNLLRDTILVEAYAGSGSRGPSYGDPAEMRANVQPTSKLAMTADGRQVVTELLAVIRPETDVPVESRVTYRGQKYRVVMAAPMPDEFRPAHRELTLGRLP